MPEPSNRSTLTQELQRLKAKKTAVDDRDIKQALQLRIDSLEAQIAAEAEVQKANEALEAAEESEAQTELKPPTSDQIRKADELIRQARVEKIRKNNPRSLELMKEAAVVAPNAPAVQEALGDDLIERKNFKEAVAAYGKAKQFSKNNVALENKHAMAVLRAKGMSSFDSAMRMDLSDSVFLTPNESLAKAGTARVLNAFLPGVGHLVMGKTWAGLSLILASIIWIVWIASMGKDLHGLLAMIAGKSSSPNLAILAPLFGYVITWLIGIGSVGSGSPEMASKRRLTRPEPPVNLPFE